MRRILMAPQRGQSFMELAIFLPILFLMLGGMVEITLTFNDYLQMLDAARYGGRSIADTNPYPIGFPTQAASPGVLDPIQSSAYDSISCDGVLVVTETRTTLNPFRVAACNTKINLNPLITLKTSNRADGSSSRNVCSASNTNTTSPNAYRDDIIVSMFATNVITATSTITLTRFSGNTIVGSTGQLVVDSTESGWSYMNQMCSAIKTSDLLSKLLVTAPNTGFAVVEVFYNRSQTFDLPGFGDVIPNPIPMHAYAIFPLVAIEATSTPTP
ncbi:MAG: TadE/TadG family type IV pilus assembly protein [Chloroflexota bacterium]